MSQPSPDEELHELTEALVGRAVRGERAAHDELLLRVNASPRLRKIVELSLFDEVRRALSVSDVVQEVCLRVGANLGGFEDRSGSATGADDDRSFWGWVATIARNLIRNAAARKEQRRRAPIATQPEAKEEGDKRGQERSLQELIQATSSIATKAQRLGAMRQHERRPEQLQLLFRAVYEAGTHNDEGQQVMVELIWAMLDELVLAQIITKRSRDLWVGYRLTLLSQKELVVKYEVPERSLRRRIHEVDAELRLMLLGRITGADEADSDGEES